MSAAFSSNETESLDRSIDFIDPKCTNPEEIWCRERLLECTEWISSNQYHKVCLQFPDNLLRFSVRILREIQSNTINVDCCILGDTSYASCCVDEIAASHIKADAIIHFGHACLSKQARLPVLYVLPDFDIDTEHMAKEFRNRIPNTETPIAIFYDIGFYYKLDKIKNALNEYSSVVFGMLTLDGSSNNIFKWKRNHFNVEEYTCIYIGRDDKSFFNLSLSMSTVPIWYIYQALIRSNLSEITPSTTAWIRRRYYYIEKCKDAQCIGIIVGTLSAPGYLDVAKHIQNLAVQRGVRTYIISVGKVNPAKLANFMEIDCFIFIGCSESNIFESRDFYKPLLSVFEAELAINPAWIDCLPNDYSVDFCDILPNGKHYRLYKASQATPTQCSNNDVSLITGRIRQLNRNNETLIDINEENAALPKTKSNAILLAGSSNAFLARSWCGLNPTLGQDEPIILQKGRSGIAMNYAEENNL